MTDWKDRFWSRVSLQGGLPLGGSCWLWTGGTTRSGYGTFGVGKKVWLVHRLTYRMFLADIPTGMEIDHLCRNRACVNPAHLEAVTRRENIRRSDNFAGKNARKTACSKGHPFTPENTYTWTDHRGTMRHCRACRRLVDKKRRTK